MTRKVLEPLWGGISSVIAYLYGILAATKVYASDPTLHQGGGILIAYALLPFVFIVVMALVAAIITGILSRVEIESKRAAIALAAIVVFFIAHGKPSWLVLFVAVIVYFVGYFHSKKNQTDAKDLSEFMEK
jgi:chromate transport protein ChrA